MLGTPFMDSKIVDKYQKTTFGLRRRQMNASWVQIIVDEKSANLQVFTEGIMSNIKMIMEMLKLFFFYLENSDFD